MNKEDKITFQDLVKGFSENFPEELIAAKNIRTTIDYEVEDKIEHTGHNLEESSKIVKEYRRNM